LADGTRKKYRYQSQMYYYRCVKAGNRYEDLIHPRPYIWDGRKLEWAIWRYIVENGIKQPDLIIEQVQIRQQQLMEQGDSVDGDIGRAKAKLIEINQERAFYQRQAGRGKISESEFDERIDETQEALDYWQGEIERLQELRDNAAKVRVGIEYTIKLLQTFESRLEEIDSPPDELRKLPKTQREKILKERQKIARALCDKITIYANGRIVIEGLLDGSEYSQFELLSSLGG
jgi:chromosome segregation ATPase